MQRRCRQGATFILRSSTAAEEVQKKATERTEEIEQLQRWSRQFQSASSQKALIIWMNLKWKRRWTHKTVKRTVTTWNTDWKQPVHQLYNGLSKHEAIVWRHVCMTKVCTHSKDKLGSDRSFHWQVITQSSTKMWARAIYLDAETFSPTP